MSSVNNLHSVSSSHKDPGSSFLFSSFSPKLSWILDTGATDHLCHFLDCFSTYSTIDPIPIKIPNQSSVVRKISGTICLSNSLVLHNVFYIPDFAFNILSVSKLTRASPCCFIFLSSFCYIQDLSHWRTIGIVEAFEGLYFLNPTTSPHDTIATTQILHSSPSSSVSFDLWHHRLGHISPSVLRILHQQFSFIPCNSELAPCDVCHMAK